MMPEPPASPARACATDRRPPTGTPTTFFQKTGRREGSTGPETDIGVRYTRPDLLTPEGRWQGRRGNRRGRGGSAVELEFTGEQEELRASVRSFLEKECADWGGACGRRDGEAPEKLWGAMIALDWPALAVPEEYGGIGLTILETAVVVEELGRQLRLGPVATVTQFAPMVVRLARLRSSSISSRLLPPAR